MAHGTIKIDTIKTGAAALAPVFVDSADREIIQGCTARLKFNGSGTPAIDDSFKRLIFPSLEKELFCCYDQCRLLFRRFY